MLGCAALFVFVSACGGGGGGDAGSVASASAVQITALAAGTVTQADAPTVAAVAATTQAVSTTSASRPVAKPPPTVLSIRARADLAGNVGPVMEVRVNGAVVGSVEVRSTQPQTYTFTVPGLVAGTEIDVVFTNNALIGGEDRNLRVLYLQAGTRTLLPNASVAVYDRGVGDAAFDGLDTLAGTGNLAWSGALRLTWPAPALTDLSQAAKFSAARFLQQASFGPKVSDINSVATIGPAAWIDAQMAMPATPDFVNYVQGKYDQGDAWRPMGSQYDPLFVAQRFWTSAATSPDQLRRRVGFALHEMLVISQADSNVWAQARAYANYLDTLNRLAFGSYRALLEEVALSPVMGIYLAHMRNRKEDPATNRLPDENFARELMQLFSIGLVELNQDGSPKLNAAGRPIETYSNADVMALAKVFTGWSWAFPDNQLSEAVFRWGGPDYSMAKDQRIDMKRMRAYPGMHSSAQVTLFAGKPQAVTIAANTSAEDSLRIALDALFGHPNVGPFVGRQLIQRLVTSNPSAAYVARVAAVFNDNGNGVRGDLGAVVRTLLLDPEARSDAKWAAPQAGFGKLREPVLRVAHWLRAFAPASSSGNYKIVWDLDPLGQRAFSPASVFGDFRPGYVPPNTALAATGSTAPEFQIVNESTTASWINLAEGMSNWGIGWNGNSPDIVASFATQAALIAAADIDGLLDNLNLLMFAGTMSATTRQDIIEAVSGSITSETAASNLERARLAVFIALISPEFLVQR